MSEYRFLSIEEENNKCYIYIQGKGFFNRKIEIKIKGACEQYPKTLDKISNLINTKINVEKIIEVNILKNYLTGLT